MSVSMQQIGVQSRMADRNYTCRSWLIVNIERIARVVRRFGFFINAENRYARTFIGAKAFCRFAPGIFTPMRDYLSRADLQKKSFFLENVDLAI